MKFNSEIFYAKILLFGEYSVIKGSKGLTIPYTHFTGELSFINDDKYTDIDFANLSNEHLRNYLKYLKDLKQSGQMNCNMDVEGLERDIDNGLYYESSIPQGYGVGSSGAMVAALYRNYVYDVDHHRSHLPVERIAELKRIFAQLESYFHGTSSGIDPLNCYIKQPLLIESSEKIYPVEIPRNKFHGDAAIFLLDTKQVGKTGPLVKIFMDNLTEPGYASMMSEQYIPTNNLCIESLLSGDRDLFFKELRTLSALQLEFLQDMIPADFRGIWKRGLITQQYSLKLCGSGGGGFLLGFTENWTDMVTYFDSLGVETIPVYKQPRS